MTLDRVPVYKTYIDWFGHGGLAAGLNNWYRREDRATLSRSTEQVFRGNYSIKVVYSTALSAQCRQPFKAPPGVEFTVDFWIHIPIGMPAITLRLQDSSLVYDVPQTVSVKGEWVKTSWTVTAAESAATAEYWEVRTTGGTALGTTFYIGWVQVRSVYDDVSCDVLNSREVPDIVSGRDQARDLAGIRPSEVGLELANGDLKYTPGNTSSVIASGLKANRQVLITAEFENKVYNLYNGYTSDYVVDAGMNQKSVHIPCTDIIARLADTDVSTQLYPSIRTGDAFRAILDAAGVYPDLRGVLSGWDDYTRFDPDIDTGASTLRWWSYVGKAKAGLDAILDSEGPPSLYYIGDSNQPCFRDRLHRQRADYPASATVEFAQERGAGVFALNDGSAVNYGWQNVINVVSGSYERTSISAEYSKVWSQPGDVNFGSQAGEYTFTGSAPNGFYDAQDPVQGQLLYVESPGTEETDIISGVSPEEYDYILVRETGGAVSFDTASMDRSGTSVNLRFLVSGTDSAATVRDMSFRAKTVESESIALALRDEVSIAEYGSTRTDEDFNFGPVAAPDAESIAALIISKRSFRRPTVTAIVQNKEATYTAMQLKASLSQPIRVNVDKWCIDDTFTIESIRHEAGENGKFHVTTFEMEQARPAITSENVFTFDQAGKGFDDGRFGGVDINPSTVFILGSSTLNSSDVLTY